MIINTLINRIRCNLRVVFPLPVSPTIIKISFFRTSSINLFSTTIKTMPTVTHDKHESKNIQNTKKIKQIQYLKQ